MFSWRRRKANGRKKQRCGRLEKEYEIPEHFRCPISLDLMKDPVSISSGITYDRDSIERWLEDGNFTCPVTQQVLRGFDRIPNHTLRKMIQEWCEDNRSFGVERIPTPKVPISSSDVNEVLSSMERSVRSLDGSGVLVLLKKINKWGVESERNRVCFIDNGAAKALALAFEGFSREGDCCQKYCNVLEEILCSLIWMFPIENGAKRVFRSSDCLKTLVWLMGREHGGKNAVLVVKELCYDQEFVDGLVGVEKVSEIVIRFIKQPVCSSSTKAALMVMFSILSSSTSNCERVRRELVELGVVPLILNMVIDGEKHLNEIGLGVFDRIVDSKEGREEACENVLTIPVLVKKILRVSELATEYSVSSIWKMSKCEKEQGRVLFEALQVGVFQKLVLLLQCGCGENTKEKATQLLKVLNPYRAGLECIESADFKNLKRSF